MSYHLIITLPVYVLLSLGLAGIFKKAGEAPWKGFVPFLNILTWLKLVGKPNWWLVWFLIPVLNFVMGIGIILDLVRSFGKHKFADQAIAVLFPYFYFPYLGFNKTDKYEGRWVDIHEKEPEKSGLREWLDAVLFAGTAALVIRVLMIEAFMIPTTSMEGSLLAGDFLFVSKFHYGVRLPQAPLSLPFVHNTMPFTTGTKSFSSLIELPYSRLPGLKEVKRNEIVVFNYPEDDRYPDVPELGPMEITSMKQNYIKRCVGVAGDTLEIRDQQIFINGQPNWLSEHAQFSYLVKDLWDRNLAKEGFRTDPNNSNRNVKPSRFHGPNSGWLEVDMDADKAAELKQKYPQATIEKIVYNDDLYGGQANIQKEWIRTKRLDPKYCIWPKMPEMARYNWTIDNFGPIYIPKKGATTPLTVENLPMYEKIIGWYEGHDLERKGDKIYIDGVEANSYTFAMDYYWMMGDNRHASLDSRFWGYVPEDHIIGRPWFVLFSWEGGPRWDRFFSGVGRWEP